MRAPGDSRVVAVDMRYVDPALNGGVKTQTQGDKSGYGWTAEVRRLDKAKRVYVVESAINALSIDTCAIPGTAALALRGLANVDGIDFAFLRGKQVVICMDNDEPFADGHPRGWPPPRPRSSLGALRAAHEPQYQRRARRPGRLARGPRGRGDDA